MTPPSATTNQRGVPVGTWAALPFYYGWVVTGACFLVYAMVSPLITSFSLFFVAVLRDFHWSRGQLSLSLAIYLVLVGAASPFAGGVVDRFGPRRVMLIGAATTAAALISLSRATTLWHFYIAFGVVAALGSSLLQIVPLTTIISNWFVRRRGTAIGIVACGSGVGHILILPLLQHLIGRIGWRGTYMALGSAVLIVPAVLIWRFIYVRPEELGLSAENKLRPKRREVNVIVEVDGGIVQRRGVVRRSRVVILDQSWVGTEWTSGRAIRTFRFWVLTLVMAMFAAGFFLISVQLVAYLVDKNYSAVFAASVVGLHGLFNVVGKFAGGLLSDRIGREKTLTLSIALFLLCIALLNFAGFAVSPAVVYAFAISYGLSYGMALPALVSSAADLFQGRHFGCILGVIMLGAFAGGAMGTWLGGHLFDLTKAYETNFALSAMLMLISGALIWKARPGRVRLMQRVVSENAGTDAIVWL
ncbi:MAG: MFS transporter [Candidatus Sulfotelmatobacter sp.]